ncbi:hypothetical protein, partial [Rickettsiales endosymbiont of Peranema trichophorum]|uniref:hypothetical protein n=1 Tax=Rickettsiales endosymbiont of Peranema trichophorum TaxID=2486577 RepID=UPI0013EED778
SVEGSQDHDRLVPSRASSLYTTENIVKLLENGIGEGGQVVMQDLSAFSQSVEGIPGDEIRVALGGLGTDKHTLLIPVYLGDNNYVGIIVRKGEDGVTRIIYNDPSGEICENTEGAWKLIEGIKEGIGGGPQFVDLAQKLQTDKSDSALYTTHTLLKLFEMGSALDGAQSAEIIEKARLNLIEPGPQRTMDAAVLLSLANDGDSKSKRKHRRRPKKKQISTEEGIIAASLEVLEGNLKILKAPDAERTKKDWEESQKTTKKLIDQVENVKKELAVVHMDNEKRTIMEKVLSECHGVLKMWQTQCQMTQALEQIADSSGMQQAITHKQQVDQLFQGVEEQLRLNTALVGKLCQEKLSHKDEKWCETKIKESQQKITELSKRIRESQATIETNAWLEGLTVPTTIDGTTTPVVGHEMSNTDFWDQFAGATSSSIVPTMDGTESKPFVEGKISSAGNFWDEFEGTTDFWDKSKGPTSSSTPPNDHSELDDSFHLKHYERSTLQDTSDITGSTINLVYTIGALNISKQALIERMVDESKRCGKQDMDEAMRVDKTRSWTDRVQHHQGHVELIGE